MPFGVYLALLASLLAPASATACDGSGECDDFRMIQTFGRKLDQNSNAGECKEAVPWPCGNAALSSFALQVVNSEGGSGSNCPSNSVATIRALNVTDGAYTDLRTLPKGICVNACGIDPISNLAFCEDRPGSFNLLRIDCPLDIAYLDNLYWMGKLSEAVPVSGSICYYGDLQQSYQATFDKQGNFWFGPQNVATIYKVTAQTVSMLTGSSMVNNTAIPGSTTSFLTSYSPGNVADIVAITSDFEGSSENYLVGCIGNKVWVQQVSNIGSTTPKAIILTMNTTVPSGASGAAWAFTDRVYCAYNNGNDGVFEPLLSTANIVSNLANRREGTVDAVFRSPSDKEESNDGMNCIDGRRPFPPPEDITTTQGGGEGDPHIHTLGGEHYLLLNQGSFTFWRYSGVDAEAHSRKVPVDFQIYAHYSGHSSYTKGLLLVDRSGAGPLNEAKQVMELTAEDCRWRKRTSSGQWQPVEGQAEADAEKTTTFHMVTSPGQKMHVELLVKSEADGFKKIAALFASCKPHHHINMKMAMFSKDDVRLVGGQLGARGHDTSNQYHADNAALASFLEGSSQKLQMDQNFLTSKDWTDLGGSISAEAYLKQADEEGPALLQSCSTDAEEEARATCSKFLGNPAMPQETFRGPWTTFQETFQDCVFDVCTGGGEAAAGLAAEILNAF